MAKPIEPTPVLSGEDAVRLVTEALKPIKISVEKQKDLNRCAAIFRQLLPKIKIQ